MGEAEETLEGARFCVCRHDDAVECAQSRDLEPHYWPAEACTCSCHDERRATPTEGSDET